MTDPNHTLGVLIVDRSGSMDGVASDAQGAINQFIADQRKVPGKMTFTLVHFDDVVETVTDFMPIADVPAFTLIPRGMTALLDAVGQTIARTGQRLADLPENERPGTVLIMIVTDGAENASHEYTLERVKAMIEEQTSKYGWVFSFFGADQAAWTGKALGIQHTVSYQNTGVGTRSAYGSLSAHTTQSRIR